MKRREVIKFAAFASGAALAAPMINRGRYRLFAQSSAQYSVRAIDLVGRCAVVDMMGPFAISAAREREWLLNPEQFTLAELQRFKEMGVAVYHLGPGYPGSSRNQMITYFARWNGFLAHNAEHLLRVDNIVTLSRAKSAGRLGVLLGLQSSDHFQTADDVDLFFELGQRVSQLTYNTRNLIGSGCTEPNDEGLSPFGAGIVERMNQRGMAIDVSHCGDRTTLDAIDASKQPVLITHSNCRALNPRHPRCKDDATITKMARSGGVMGITMIRAFVRNSEPTTIEDVLNHFDHVIRLVGVEHVGVGSDLNLDGAELSPEGMANLRSTLPTMGFRDRFTVDRLNHSKRIFDLTEGLIRRNHSDPAIESILGGNFMRALGRIWPAPLR